MFKAPYPFRNGSTYITQLLFYEMAYKVEVVKRVVPPIFSLYRDIDGLINAQKAFVELGDPTGYKFTQEYLGGDMKHWEALVSAMWFQKALDCWVHELRLKLKTEALEKVKEHASGTGPQAYQAAKFLATEGWLSKDETRGRPSKAELTGELKKQAALLTEEDEDIARMGGLN